MSGQTDPARKPGARKRQREGMTPGRVVGVIVGVLVLVGVGWGAWATLGTAEDPDERESASAARSTDAHSEHESASPTTDSAPTEDPSPAVEESAAEEPADAAGCAETVAAAEDVVAAARTGIDNWRQHVKASTDWGAGRITEERKKAIWKRTRLAGPGDLDRYDAALDSYAATAGGCEGAPEAEPCAERLTTLEASMDAAAGALGDWERHQLHMASFAEGDFGAAHANAMWNRAKREAPVNLGKFAAADATLAQAPSCG